MWEFSSGICVALVYSGIFRRELCRPALFVEISGWDYWSVCGNFQVENLCSPALYLRNFGWNLFSSGLLVGIFKWDFCNPDLLSGIFRWDLCILVLLSGIFRWDFRSPVLLRNFQVGFLSVSFGCRNLQAGSL